MTGRRAERWGTSARSCVAACGLHGNDLILGYWIDKRRIRS